MRQATVKVGDVMTAQPHACNTRDMLVAAAQIMWDHDCGCVPVVDDDGKVVAMITDRDACMAAFTQGRTLGDIAVVTAMSSSVVTCKADDSIDDAERLMRQNQVRRLPVTDEGGALVGVVSMNDLLRIHERHVRTAAGAGSLAGTLGAIGAPRAGRLTTAAA
ncbi:MAG: CBS domain-containing protein [Deltaproteobacteria bacterium]|nr:CBS domain-containing protein [Deltaproteobacteria bacterium]